MGDRVMWFNGAVVPWGEARVHVWDELALRGANVFEGITAFWDTDTKKHQILAGPEHLDRLFDSAHLADIPTAATRSELWSALAAVAAAHPGVDVYLRPTFYAASGRSTLSPDSAGGLYIGGFEFNPTTPPQVRVIVSDHRRFGGPIGAMAKAGGSYLDFRLFERDRLQHGVEHVVILNERGNVAEADGAAVLLIGKQSITTPSLDSGILDSITKRIVLDIARDSGCAVTERGVLREELYRGQPLLAGTLMGVRLLDSVDGVDVHDAAATATARTLAADYERLCRGNHVLSKIYLTPLT
jgi:branched-chain amino acid aminotransferase